MFAASTHISLTLSPLMSLIISCFRFPAYGMGMMAAQAAAAPVQYTGQPTVAAPARPLFPSASHPGPSQSPGLDQAKATFPAYGQTEKKPQLIATTGSSSKIIRPPEDISLEEMRASMPRYKPQETAPAPPQSAAAAALQYSMAGAAAAQASAAGLAAGQGHIPVMMPQQLDAASQLQLLQQQQQQQLQQQHQQLQQQQFHQQQLQQAQLQQQLRPGLIPGLGMPGMSVQQLAIPSIASSMGMIHPGMPGQLIAARPAMIGMPGAQQGECCQLSE